MTTYNLKSFTIPRIEIIDGKKKPVFMRGNEAILWQKDMDIMIRNQDYFNKEDEKVKCIFTGKVNDLTVIDCDTEKSYLDLIEMYPELTSTLTIKTPKGYHLYAKYNEYFQTTTNANMNIDIRNDGAIVFGFGTVRDDGLCYEIIKDLPLIELSNGIFDHVKPGGSTNSEKKKKAIKPKTENLVSEIDETANKVQKKEKRNDKYTELVLNVIKNEKTVNGNWKIDYSIWIKICWILKSCGYSKDVFEKYNIETENQKNGNDLWKKTKVTDNIDVIYELQNIAKTINPHGYKDWLVKHNEYLTLEILDKGENDIAKFISKFICDEIVYCKNEWYYCDSKTNLWKYTKEPSAYITTKIQNKINESLQCVLIKLENYENEEEKKKLEEQKIKYSTHYKNVCKSSNSNQIIKYLKTYVANEEFHELLDVALYKIAYKNGTLDLKTMKFKKGFEKSDYITKTIPFDYEKPSSEDVAVVRKILKKICNYNESHLEYYLSSLGYAFTGDSQREQIFNYFVGQTASNGKSMPFETLEFLMPNYVKKGTPDILDKGADVRKEIATWRGILLLWINELSTKKKDEDFIKALADGTNHKYNRLYSTESIMMKIGFKIFCVSNNSLNIKVDPGVTRRFKLAEFVSQFKDEYKQDDFEKLEFKLDKDLSEKLKTTYKHAFLYLIFSYSNQYYIDKCLKPYPIEWDNEAKQTLADNDKFKEWFDDKFYHG